MEVILKVEYSNSSYKKVSRIFALLLSGECQRTLLNNEKSTLVQVMAWCHRVTRHYLCQCWPRSRSSQGVPRPQWVNKFIPEQNGWYFADNFSECPFSFEQKFLGFDQNFTGVCSLGSKWQWVSIELGNGSVRNRQKAITRAGVKYVLSNTNTNTNTKIWIFQIQIQIQIFCSSLIQIQIQIQIHRFKYKYKYKYVQPNISAENCSDPK